MIVESLDAAADSLMPHRIHLFQRTDMFAKFFIQTPATFLLLSLSLVPTQVNADSPLTTSRAEYLPAQAISYDIGSKSMRGYYAQADGKCSVFLMITERIDPETAPRLSATRVRLVLRPGAMAGLDSAEGRSLNLTCDRTAARLLVDEGETSVLITQQKTEQLAQ
jgi:hypothetical protein